MLESRPYIVTVEATKVGTGQGHSAVPSRVARRRSMRLGCFPVHCRSLGPRAFTGGLAAVERELTKFAALAAESSAGAKRKTSKAVIRVGLDMRTHDSQKL